MTVPLRCHRQRRILVHLRLAVAGGVKGRYFYRLSWIIPASTLGPDLIPFSPCARPALSNSCADCPRVYCSGRSVAVWALLPCTHAERTSAGGTGRASSSRTVQGRWVKPAAMAGVRWR